MTVGTPPAKQPHCMFLSGRRGAGSEGCVPVSGEMATTQEEGKEGRGEGGDGEGWRERRTRGKGSSLRQEAPLPLGGPASSRHLPSGQGLMVGGEGAPPRMERNRVLVPPPLGI